MKKISYEGSLAKDVKLLEKGFNYSFHKLIKRFSIFYIIFAAVFIGGMFVLPETITICFQILDIILKFGLCGFTLYTANLFKKNIKLVDKVGTVLDDGKFYSLVSLPDAQVYDLKISLDSNECNNLYAKIVDGSYIVVRNSNPYLRVYREYLDADDEVIIEEFEEIDYKEHASELEDIGVKKLILRDY